MTSKASLCAGALFLLAIGATGTAKADTFDFSYSGYGNFGSIQATGTLTATLQSPGKYLVTAITGERNGIPIANLIKPGGYDGNDNILNYPAVPGPVDAGYVDSSGLAYSAGGVNYNVYYTDSYEESPGGSTVTSFNVAPHNSPAPVPGGGLLSFLALGLAGLAWRRKAIVGPCRSALVKLEPPLAD